MVNKVLSVASKIQKLWPFRSFHSQHSMKEDAMSNSFKDTYEKNGYAVLENFFSDEEVEEMKAEAARLLNMAGNQSHQAIMSMVQYDQNKDDYYLSSGDKIGYFFEKDAFGADGKLQVPPSRAVMKLGHGIHYHSDVFRKYTFHDKVKDVCRRLGFKKPVVIQSMLNCKNPKIGSEASFHQDATYLYTEPINLIGFWYALEDATLENGCLWFEPGSHHSGIHRRYVRNPDPTSKELVVFTDPLPDYTLQTFKPAPVKIGTCVILHGGVVHNSTPNKSDKSRYAYTHHVVETEGTKYAKDNWLQPSKEHPFEYLYDN